jgi:hypothetical protein
LAAEDAEAVGAVVGAGTTEDRPSRGFPQEQAIVITMAANSAATGRVSRPRGLTRPPPTIRLLVIPDQGSANYQVNTIRARQRSKLRQEDLEILARAEFQPV